MGFTKEANPMQLVGVMYHTHDTIPGDGIDVFRFKAWPSYTMDELLPEILKKFRKIDTIPGLIWVDDQSLIQPLRIVLKAANEAVDFHNEIDVEWYPPPSEEERAFYQDG